MVVLMLVFVVIWLGFCWLCIGGCVVLSVFR